jgi:N-formylglutamate deformylase
MTSPVWQTEIGDGPLVACAIHNGHVTRPEIAELMRLDAVARRYEEDPYTGEWTVIAPTRIVGQRSRFELDLNRPRDKAVYQSPTDCWGLDVWKSPPPTDVVNRSLAEYEAFYAHVRSVLERLVARHGRVVVFDLHSYNHVRNGAGGTSAEARENPEINLGTRSMDRTFWSPIVERWLAEMRRYDYLGRSLDVRENVKFFGGYFPTWIHQNFPGSVCALAIEVKKFFMDEWTGQLDVEKHQAIGQALAAAAAGVSAELENWQHARPVA